MAYYTYFPPPVAADAPAPPIVEFPLPPHAPTVTCVYPLPAAIGDVAPTVDWLADTAPAFTTTVAVWVTPIPSIVAEIVFDSAWVDDNEIGRASCRERV